MSELITNSTTPKYKLKQNDDNLTLRVALPGVTKENLKVASEGGTLKLTADRGSATEESWTLLSESPLAESYLLELDIPSNYNLSEVEAKFEKNILTLTIPTRKPNRLEIPLE